MKTLSFVFYCLVWHLLWHLALHWSIWRQSALWCTYVNNNTDSQSCSHRSPVTHGRVSCLNHPLEGRSRSLTHGQLLDGSDFLYVCLDMCIREHFIILIVKPLDIKTCARSWTMLGWGHTCSAACLPSKTQQAFVALKLPHQKSEIKYTYVHIINSTNSCVRRYYAY